MDENIKSKSELMEKNLDRVINWVNNCDQKASILLALLGLVVTLVFTSDVFVKIDSIIITPFFTYLKTGEGYFCFIRTLLSILLFVSLISVSLLIKYLIATLSANLNYDKIRDKEPGMVEKSYIYFNSIANMKYNDFNPSTDAYYEDLRSQVYANSLICKKKFENYAKAIRCIYVALPSLFLSFLLISLI